MDDFRAKKLLQIGNIITPLICGIITAVSSLGIEGGYQAIFTGDSYESLIGPAPITFAIWGPIFFFLALFVIYQARDLLKKESEQISMPYVHEVSVFFMLSTIMAAGWYLLWSQRWIWPSVLAMILYLFFILAAYLRLNINKISRPLKEHLIIGVSWSMYAGWVTVATIVSITTGLISIGFDTPIINERIWAVLVLLIALVIYLLVLVTRNDYIFPLVGAWALIGIVIERLDPNNPLCSEVALVATIGAIVLVIATGIGAFIQYKQKKNI